MSVVKGLRKLAISFLLLWVTSFFCFGQTITTEGTDFWYSYMNNWLQDPGNPVILEVYISSADTASGVIDIPNSANWGPRDFTVYPGTATRVVLPTNLAMAEGSGRVEDKGVHITSDRKISVYAMNKRQYSADVTVLLPTVSLGREYRVMAHWEPGTRNNGDNSQAEFMIVSIADSTEIEIVPSYPTTDGRPADEAFTVILNQGQTYQLQADGDLTGSLIRSRGSGNCQNFAVFGGNRYTKVGECDHPDGHDHLYSQLYPVNTWGQEFTMVPFRSRSGGDVIKLLAAEDSTEIRINNDTYLLDAGGFEQLLLDGVQVIRSDKPITVGHFSRSQACDNTTSDPFLITISPNEQLLQKVTFNAPVIATLDEYYLNVITPAKGVNSIRLDGGTISGQFSVVPGNSDYYYARIAISQGNHTLESSDGFIAYVYGYGNNESFGYSTGASLENLRLEIVVSAPDGSQIPVDSICKNTEVRFVPQADSVFTRFYWDFGDGNSFYTEKPQAVTHTYREDGEYLVELVAETAEGDCYSGGQEISRKIIKVLTPTAAIIGPRSVCPNTDLVPYAAVSDWDNTYQWFVSGGTVDNINADSLSVNWGDTNDKAIVGVVPTSNLGCVGDTIIYSVRINIQLDPEAPFGPDSLCSSDITDIIYSTYAIPTSRYEWYTSLGATVGENGNPEIPITWDGHGTGKVWFRESSTLDDVCSGVSDTLRVYIDRDPQKEAEILVPDTLEVGQRFDLNINADSLYGFFNWDLGDGTMYDSLEVTKSLVHLYDCPGDYQVLLGLYDTLRVCRGVTSAQKNIHVLEPQAEIFNVTTKEENDSILEVHLKIQNLNFLSEGAALRRTGYDPPGSTWVDWQMNSNGSFHEDESADPQQTVYEYRIVALEGCPQPMRTPQHRNIRLQIDNPNGEQAVISWNAYVNWRNGVSDYELWKKVDDQGWELMEETDLREVVYSNQAEGFEHCFRVRAHENGGNETYSWSNISCTLLIPELLTYNVISPNGDGINDVFVIDRIEHYPESELVISNRYGKELLRITGYRNNWNGSINGRPLPSGVYYWTLILNEPRVPQSELSGYVQILR